MGYICKKGEKKWIGYAGAGAGGRQPKSKRNRGGGATVKWKQSCRRSEDLERGYETSEEQDIEVVEKKEGRIESDLIGSTVEKVECHK